MLQRDHVRDISDYDETQDNFMTVIDDNTLDIDIVNRVSCHQQQVSFSQNPVTQPNPLCSKTVRILKKSLIPVFHVNVASCQIIRIYIVKFAFWTT